MKRVILLTEGISSYARGLLHGVSEYSRRQGPWTFYRESLAPFYRASILKRTLARLRAWSADGIIARVQDPKFMEEIIALGKPCITTHDDVQISSIPNVVSDYQTTGAMAAEHLLSLGLRHFAFCGFDRFLWSRKRGESFTDHLKQKGFFPKVYHNPRTKLWEKEQSHLIKWLKSLPRPVGIMACNDDRGQQVIDSCRIAGIQTPEEAAVIGVDNDSLLCNLSNPPLSSIAINTAKAGFQAAQLLHQLMEGEKPEHLTILALATHVEIRQSTETLAIDAPDVVRAIRYIRENARKQIQIRDVAEEAALSQRALYEKFKKALGRTVHDEIKRIRIQEISRFLVETDLPVYQIASHFSFTCMEHIARYFKQATGLSPLAYRKKHGSLS